MKKIGEVLKPLRRIDGRDVHIYGGLVGIAVGGWLWQGPASLAVVGALLFYLGVWRMR